MNDHPSDASLALPDPGGELQHRFGDRWQIEQPALGVWSATRRSRDGRAHPVHRCPDRGRSGREDRDRRYGGAVTSLEAVQAAHPRLDDQARCRPRMVRLHRPAGAGRGHFHAGRAVGEDGRRHGRRSARRAPASCWQASSAHHHDARRPAGAAGPLPAAPARITGRARTGHTGGRVLSRRHGYRTSVRATGSVVDNGLAAPSSPPSLSLSARNGHDTPDIRSVRPPLMRLPAPQRSVGLGSSPGAHTDPCPLPSPSGRWVHAHGPSLEYLCPRR